MPHAYAKIAFTPAVRDMQTRMGSRGNYASTDDAETRNKRIGSSEAEFIAARDGFYQATVSETGWPYVQFRGGPAGFLKVLDPSTLGYADFRGNMQYISVGNFVNNDRVSIILMDYANRVRLKILGRVRIVGADDDPALLAKLALPNYRARVQRGVIITVEGFDWNCPQHITPRFTEAEIAQATAAMHTEIAQLKSQLAAAVAVESPAAKVIGSGPLALVISGIRQLTPRVRAYELRVVDGAPLPAIGPGGYIDVPVHILNEESLPTNSTRRYSITDVSPARDQIEIAVQEDPLGAGGSIAVHRDYQLGTTVLCGMPGNDFMLHVGERPAVLIAGGIGITPIVSMAMALVRERRKVELHYAARSAREAAFALPLKAALGGAMTLYRSDAGERLAPQLIVANALTSAPNRVFYVCGPSALIDAVRVAGAQAGVAADDIRFERFSVAINPDDAPVRVTLRRSGKTIDVSASMTILDAVQAAGIEAPASCRAGTCGTCAVKVIDGTPDHRDKALTPAERDQAALMCICVSRATSAELVLDL